MDTWITIIVGVSSAVVGGVITLVAKRVRSQDQLDKIIDDRIKEHIVNLERDNNGLRNNNLALAQRISVMEKDHFRIKQLELSVRMLSDALGRIDPDNATLAMVRILFASMYDERKVVNEPDDIQA